MSKFPPKLVDNVNEWNLGDEMEDNLYDVFMRTRPIIEKYMLDTIDTICRGLKLRISVNGDDSVHFVLWGDDLIGDTHVLFSLDHVIHELAFEYDEQASVLAALQKRLRPES